MPGLDAVKIKPGAREQHVVAALGYLVTRLFPARRQVRIGRKHWE
jgi:hypothetical protein